MSRLRRSVADPSPWKHMFNPTAVYMAVMVDMVTLGEVTF